MASAIFFESRSTILATIQHNWQCISWLIIDSTKEFHVDRYENISKQDGCLDYCNSLINNIAKQDLSKLQRVQNCLASVLLWAPRFSPSLPLLKQLHWLPVNYRIKFKLSTLTYRALAIHQPPYLASLLHFSNVPRQLRSSTSQQLSIPRTKLNLGKRAFSVAAPIIWNEL